MNRRRYLAALATTIPFTGCLNFSQSQESTTTQSSEQATTQAATASTQPPSQESTPAEETATPELPEGTLWAFRANAPFIAGPVHKDGLVFATSVDRHLYALNTGDGTEQWTAETTNELDKALTVCNGVVVASGADEVLGVRLTDGSTVFNETGYGSGIRAQVSTTKTVYQSLFPHGLRALDPVTGTALWTVENDLSGVEIATDGETVCVAYNPEEKFGDPPWAFGGYDAETGEELWYFKRNPDRDRERLGVAVSEGLCFATDGAQALFIDARSGTIQAEESLNVSYVHGAADGVVAVGSSDLGLQGRDMSTGNSVWQTGESVRAYGPNTTDESRLQFYEDDQLYTLEIPSGEYTTSELGSLGDADLTGELAVSDSSVFLTTEDARVRAVERQ
ncbi:PQQ-binding-like beta-propeller repeat protein [Halobaculum limi]|uniref:outer membrane protein assembly factor BamB family protein n=1 Tax=Halobaculum limi TaxID=3031916 RepID=UPI002406B802|nr:PQQ-binding-like beta-propeller repeat protein [Halobaculum sp. YSMS11]